MYAVRLAWLGLALSVRLAWLACIVKLGSVRLARLSLLGEAKLWPVRRIAAVSSSEALLQRWNTDA